jgi:hypothetical protein
MTLQAGDKLMSLTDLSEMLTSPITPCTAGGTRATAQSAIGWAVTCGTAGKPSRLGWNSTPTSASKPGARTVPSGPRGSPPRVEQIRAGRSSSASAAPVARFLRPVKMSPVSEGFACPRRADSPVGRC